MGDAGYAVAIGSCFTCHRRFGFNPHRVPSYDPSLEDPTKPAGRQPVCQSCFEDWNRRRVEAGLEPVPMLTGAYEPLPAADLIWD